MAYQITPPPIKIDHPGTLDEDFRLTRWAWLLKVVLWYSVTIFIGISLHLVQ